MAMTFALEDSYNLSCPRLCAISWSCGRRARFSTSFAINMLLGHAMGDDQVVAVVVSYGCPNITFLDDNLVTTLPHGCGDPGNETCLVTRL